MKKKKILAILLTLCMAVSMAACGSDNVVASTAPEESAPSSNVPQAE